MITSNQKNQLLENITEILELPVTAYQKAEERYRDIGEWLGRDLSQCHENDPHVFPQGSFRLGTAIRPLDEAEEYDLDLVCKLQRGILKSSHTQQELKELIGQEIEAYRAARGIKAPVEDKHRCWRLDYADTLKFHMDIVPCIPADESKRMLIMEAMKMSGESDLVAESASHLTVSITDDRHQGYRQICDDWNISNPEGYAQWFEARMNQALLLMEAKAQVDDLPLYKRKTPLQRSIQLLKRHRDNMFQDDRDVMPISIIITTLAARAYQGEADVGSALSNILLRMGGLVNSGNPRVPNPVDPGEDFADRWSMPQYRELNLEANFWNWLQQAQNDFELIGSSDNMTFVAEQVEHKFSVHMDSRDLSRSLGLAYTSASVKPKSHTITDPPKPWCKESM